MSRNDTKVSKRVEFEGIDILKSNAVWMEMTTLFRHFDTIDKTALLDTSRVLMSKSVRNVSESDSQHS